MCLFNLSNVDETNPFLIENLDEDEEEAAGAIPSIPASQPLYAPHEAAEENDEEIDVTGAFDFIDHLCLMAVEGNQEDELC